MPIIDASAVVASAMHIADQPLGKTRNSISPFPHPPPAAGAFLVLGLATVAAVTREVIAAAGGVGAEAPVTSY